LSGQPKEIAGAANYCLSVRIAFVMGGIPELGHSGSTIAAWAIIEELLSAGHEVTALLLPAPELVDETVATRLDAIRGLGADVRLVEIPAASPPPRGRWRARLAFARSLVGPRDEELFPSARARASVREAVAETEAFLAFGIEAIAACAGVDRGLAVLSHPPGVSRGLRLRYVPPRSLAGRAGEWSFLAHADRRAASLLQNFASVGIFSEHHSAWARRHGVDAWYAHYPMPDLAGPRWRELRAAEKPNEISRILMIGHLRGIGTISGLHLFVPEIMPRLATALGPEGFEVHVVGGHEPPEELRAGLRHPAVRLRGPLDEPDEEFLRADVLLAPNPTPTGASARILSGLAFGCCVVAHTDSLVGIPELRDSENCLLGADGRELAEATLRALADVELRERLGDNGRALYERLFSPSSAARRLSRELERLARSSER
jgi:glycosyltransferase involved in cell wall biosynthesis